MSNQTYLTIGKIFFAVAVMALGVVHFVTGNFPTGLMPVYAGLPGRTFLVYLSGGLLVIAGGLILSNKYTNAGALLSAIILIIFLLGLDIPKLIMEIKGPNAWVDVFETAMLLCGSLILLPGGKPAKKSMLVLIAGYIFAAGLLVFAVQHFMYAQYIAMLITGWIPFKLFWAYFVGVAFLAVAISIGINKLVRLSTAVLGLMFLLWVCLLHGPLVVQHLHMADAEAEWSSLFVALGVSGVSFLIAGSKS